jgi:hypothetical protein
VALDVETLIHRAAKIEFYVLGIAFILTILVLSVGAGVFIVKAALDHSFPEWFAYMKKAAMHLRTLL